MQREWPVHLTERRRLRRWFWAIAATTVAALVLGGITRLTQSGLSIVDWQPIMGAVPPLTGAQWQDAFERYQRFPEYRQLRPLMTLDEFRTIFLWEYFHRLVARMIGLVFLGPFLWFWRAGYLTRPLMRRALGLFGLGAMQGLMGWLMVKSGLVDRPSVSHYRLAAHLTLALLILGMAVWLARGLAVTEERGPRVPAGRSAIVRGLAVVGALLVLQIVWGAFVAGLKAGFVYTTFPLMAGRLVPPSALALDPPTLNLVQNMATVQWIHRILGTLLLATAFVHFVRARGHALDVLSARLNGLLFLLIALQYTLGVFTLVLRVPVTLAVMHQAVAAAIVVVWVLCLHHARAVRGACFVLRPSGPSSTSCPTPRVAR